MKGILGRKLGMTQVFSETGTLIPVTVVVAESNVVLQKKTLTTDGYQAVQLGLQDINEKRATKPQLGHAKKANTTVKCFVKEIRSVEMAEQYEAGAEVKVDVFTAGEFVDVSGVSKGKGFTGSIQRHNHKTGPHSHGSGHHRARGSLATIGRNNSQINKGTKMAGQDGGFNTTNQGLEIIKVDLENSYLLIKGNVPGPKRGLVVVTSTVKNRKPKEAVNLLDYREKPVIEEVEEVVLEEEVLEAVEDSVSENSAATEETVSSEEAAVNEEVKED